MSREMMGETKLKSLLEIALKHSKAEQTEVAISAGNWALTRFANSVIHQNMTSQNAVLHVKAVFGKKVASGSTNRIDEDGIKSLVDEVVNMARLQDENPDFVSLPEPSESYGSVDPYFESTANSSPETRAAAVRKIVDEASAVNGTAAGSLFVKSYERAVMNSLGINGYYRGTSANVVDVVTGPDGGFGYAAATAGNIDDIDMQAIGAEAAGVAKDSRNPADSEPGEYETILMPYAVCDMLGMLRWMAFGAMAYQEKRSFLVGKLGQKIVTDAVSLWDNGLDPHTLAAPFDAEGVAKRRLDLIKDGVASGLLYDSYTAHREGKKSTGHAYGGVYELGANYGNLIMAPGDATVDDMIKNTKRGILVTRFHYTNVAHGMSTTFTGMTRDGTFWIENGQIVRPVKNLRFTQSIVDALANVEMIGKDRRLEDGVLAPAIKTRKFRFSSATAF